MAAYVIFTNVHNDTEVREIDTPENKVSAHPDGEDEDPLAAYFERVEEALSLRVLEGPTGESYWQWFRIYFD
jgi:hypothetical protein